MSLEGRVALVTGGGGYVGSAICEALAELGASIVVLDVDRDRCNATAGRVGDTYHVETLPLVVDLAQSEELSTVPPSVLGRFGRLDILVNCAALVGTSKLKGWAVPFAEQDTDTWRRALEVNLTAPFALVQACSEALEVSGSASVVNIGSIYGMVGPHMALYEGADMGNPAAYAASKGGLLQLTRWLATVLAPKVRVNCVTAGGIRRGQPEPFHSRYVAHTPLQRMATEEDLKGAVAYLSGDLSSYVTGHNLVVDGGWTVW